MRHTLNPNTVAIGAAVLAAVLYALSTPVSKHLLQTVEPMMAAAFLYLGAGIGVGAMMLLRRARHTATEQPLQRTDLPFALAMIALDIAAPILMMYGLRTCSAANTALLNNFEIVATALIALLFFREQVGRRLWIAIGLVTVASLLLSVETDSVREVPFLARLALGPRSHALLGFREQLHALYCRP